MLHLTHTDLRHDPRVIKELRALECLGSYSCIGIGVELDEGAAGDSRALESQIITLRLYSRALNWLPRSVRYILNTVELTLVLSIRGLKEQPLVVHCHDTMVLPAGVIIKHATGCKLIYDAHELESEKRGQSRLLSKGTLLIEKICWRSVDLLVSVSESIISWYEDKLGSKEHVIVLNSPEVDDVKTEKNTTSHSGRYLRDIYNIPDNCLVFVYLGILSEGRGIKTVLDAFTAFPIDAHVVFVGYGDLSRYIQECANKYHNIHFHKPVPHNEVVTLVRSADVGLCLIENASLSDYYALPNKLFEYCFAGLFVLASDFPEIKKVVEQNSLGICCTPNPYGVQKAVQFLIDSTPSRITADISEFGWGAQAERLVESYHKLLAR